MKVVSARGAMLVENMAYTSPQVVYNPTTGEFVRPRLTVIDGVPTWDFTAEVAEPPEQYYDPISGKTFAPAVTVIDGLPTWTFSEKS